jgi:hypothetical protein
MGGWLANVALCVGLTASGCLTPLPARPAEPEMPAAQVLVEVAGSSVNVDGKPVDSDPKALRAALERSGYYAIVVRGDAPVDDTALGRVLEAAQTSKPPQLRLELGELRIALEMGVRRSTTNHVVATLGSEDAQFWSIDGGSFEELGTWQLGDPASEAAIRAKLQRACAQAHCEASLDIRETPIVAALLAWKRVSADANIAGVSLSVASLHQGPPRTPAPGESREPRPATAVKGRLPPSLVQIVVRARFGEFRRCYEAGLGRNAKLGGRVMARFVIDRDGSVSNVADGGSDMPDAEVTACVLKAFYGLRFPRPDGGIVTVVYPIMLSPGQRD